jgi:ATP-binding cassette subfamily B protein
VSPRASATAHELARVELLAGLPGEVLAQLAREMRREDVAPGATVVSEGDNGERFYVLLSGLMAVTQSCLGPRGLLRPGAYFGEVSLTMGIPRTASVRAMTPATVASCDRAAFDQYVRPLFADDR